MFFIGHKIFENLLNPSLKKFRDRFGSCSEHINIFREVNSVKSNPLQNRIQGVFPINVDQTGDSVTISHEMGISKNKDSRPVESGERTSARVRAPDLDVDVTLVRDNEKSHANIRVSDGELGRGGLLLGRAQRDGDRVAFYLNPNIPTAAYMSRDEAEETLEKRLVLEDDSRDTVVKQLMRSPEHVWALHAPELGGEVYVTVAETKEAAERSFCSTFERDSMPKDWDVYRMLDIDSLPKKIMEDPGN